MYIIDYNGTRETVDTWDELMARLRELQVQGYRPVWIKVLPSIDYKGDEE